MPNREGRGAVPRPYGRSRKGVRVRIERVLSVVILLLVGLPASSRAEGCPERPACHGCGCKGGTGYRGPNGDCVGFRQLEATCGPAPHARCVFENAPGTGLNRDCALAPKRRTRDSPDTGT